MLHVVPEVLRPTPVITVEVFARLGIILDAQPSDNLLNAEVDASALNGLTNSVKTGLSVLKDVLELFHDQFLRLGESILSNLPKVLDAPYLLQVTVAFSFEFLRNLKSSRPHFLH